MDAETKEETRVDSSVNLFSSRRSSKRIAVNARGEGDAGAEPVVYALVQFCTDECYSVVPSHFINSDNLDVGSTYTVKWNNTKYNAILKAIGSKEEIEKEEDRIIKEIELQEESHDQIGLAVEDDKVCPTEHQVKKRQRKRKLVIDVEDNSEDLKVKQKQKKKTDDKAKKRRKQADDKIKAQPEKGKKKKSDEFVLDVGEMPPDKELCKEPTITVHSTRSSFTEDSSCESENEHEISNSDTFDSTVITKMADGCTIRTATEGHRSLDTKIMSCEKSITELKLHVEKNSSKVQNKLDSILRMLEGQQTPLRSPVSCRYSSRQTYYSTPSRLMNNADFNDVHSSVEQYSYDSYGQYELDNSEGSQTPQQLQLPAPQQHPPQQLQLPAPQQHPLQQLQLPAPQQHPPQQLKLPAPQQYPPQQFQLPAPQQHPPQQLQLPAPQQPAQPQNAEQLLTNLTPAILAEIKANSSSRANFATNLSRRMFSEEVRANSNVGGKCGKLQLDPIVISKIKTACFQMYPLSGNEIELVEWKRCHRAIDEGSRRLNRKPL